jgi:hypothetical protein
MIVDCLIKKNHIKKLSNNHPKILNYRVIKNEKKYKTYSVLYCIMNQIDINMKFSNPGIVQFFSGYFITCYNCFIFYILVTILICHNSDIKHHKRNLIIIWCIIDSFILFFIFYDPVIQNFWMVIG